MFTKIKNYYMTNNESTSNSVIDYYLYNGQIERASDLRFINCVHSKKKGQECVVIMVSGGGSPDAAYKMARYLQLTYGGYKVIVSGLCKSAATLFAIGAREIMFCPYGELGPLDIQLSKDDKIAGQESGLNIREAFSTLEKQARDTFMQNTINTIKSSDGVVTFKTASESSIELVSALYGPIFMQIEPEEVGSRSRSMRIGEDYANRLNCGNIDLKGIKRIATKYASHSFVIDMIEAKDIFMEVRQVNDIEQSIIDSLGLLARFPESRVIIEKLEIEENKEDNNPTKEENNNDTTAKSRKKKTTKKS